MTCAEKALKRLKEYEQGTAGDWWNDCIEGTGYDAVATDHVDQEHSRLALYIDGSCLRYNGHVWDVLVVGGDHDCISDDGEHLAVWDVDRWILETAVHEQATGTK